MSCELDCGAPPECGDMTCDPGEDECSCAADCGAPPANEAGLCGDGADNDCDSLTDCADPDCETPTCTLNATTNVQGRFLNGVAAAAVCDTPATGYSGRFLHIEQKRDFRLPADWVHAVAATWPEAPACSGDPECDDGLFCNGEETCAGGACQPGSDPCAGGACDEAGDVCTSTCGDGTCDPGEDCDGCPADCPSFDLPAAVCGNGLCEAGDGEDCVSCPQDCDGVQGGKPSGRYCCGFGGQNPVGCAPNSVLCTSADGFACTETPVGSGGTTCCGDLVCESPEDGVSCAVDCGAPPVCPDGTCDPGEDQCSCAADCGAPPATEAGLCTDGEDNDCDGDADCADADCFGLDPACQPVDCSTFGDKQSCNAQAECRWDNRNKVCV